MNITDVIWRNSHAWPNRLAVINDGKQLTFGGLRQLTELVSARLAQTGIRRGDCVAVALSNPLAYLVLTLALARIGAVTSPLKLNVPEALKQIGFDRHSIRAVVLEHGEPWRSAILSADKHLDVLTLFARPEQGVMVDVPRCADDVDDEPWLIVQSSGTTGSAKSIVRTHRRETVQSILTLPEKATQREQRTFVFIALGIGAGISTVLQQLYGGRTVVLTTSATPENFFSVIERHQPTHLWMSTGTATTMVVHAARKLPDSMQVCKSLASVSLMGAAVSPSIRSEIEQRICPHLQIFYGSTEAGFLAELTPEMFHTLPGATGRILPWVQAQVVDENDRPLPMGQSGVLRFKTPAMAGGYLKDAESSARAFREGWFYPGDMGALDAAGNISLAGRVDHLLNVGGTKVNPETIEGVLNMHPAVLESAVVLVTHEDGLQALAALVVQKERCDADELKQWCREHLSPQTVPRLVMIVPALKKNAGGKLKRAEMAKLVRWSSLPISDAAILQ